jgi:aryl-alcohol dehydrogenase-like predicted oxidoreductase
MKQRQLGKNGPKVSALGFGLMSLSSTYGRSDDQESIRTIHRALDLGINFLDTAEAYGGGHNEQLAATVLGERRQEVFLATKFGIRFADGRMHANGTPENVRRAIDGSLRRLGVDHVDLYYLHRRDPETPIEDSVGAMAELVKAGKVRHLGLSAVSGETLRRAHAVHPITALQSEYSLWTRDPEKGVLDACEELGVGFVAYSPLGRGFFAGAVRSTRDLEENDFRHLSPRFEADNLQRNLRLVEGVEALARSKKVEPSQLALAWLLHQRPWIIPLFGTRRAAHVESNARSVDVELSASDLRELDTLSPPGAAAGEPLPEFLQYLVES